MMTEFLSIDYSGEGARVALERRNTSTNSWAWIDTRTMQWYAFSEYDAGVRYLLEKLVFIIQSLIWRDPGSHLSGNGYGRAKAPPERVLDNIGHNNDQKAVCEYSK